MRPISEHCYEVQRIKERYTIIFTQNLKSGIDIIEKKGIPEIVYNADMTYTIRTKKNKNSTPIMPYSRWHNIMKRYKTVLLLALQAERESLKYTREFLYPLEFRELEMTSKEIYYKEYKKQLKIGA